MNSNKLFKQFQPELPNNLYLLKNLQRAGKTAQLVKDLP